MNSSGSRAPEWTLSLARPIKRWTDASVGYAVSVTDAASKGLGKFRESVTESNLGKLDLSNGFLRGTVAAWAVALEEIPRAVSRFYEALVTPPSPAKRAKPVAMRSVRGKRR